MEAKSFIIMIEMCFYEDQKTLSPVIFLYF